MRHSSFSVSHNDLRTPHAQFGPHQDGSGEAYAIDSTLNFRIASIFIVALVSVLGTAMAGLLEWHAGSAPKGGSVLNHRILKCIAAGVIASVGFVHVLAESAEMLRELSPFPWAFVVAMLGAFVTLLLNQVFDYLVSSTHGDPDESSILTELECGIVSPQKRFSNYGNSPALSPVEAVGEVLHHVPSYQRGEVPGGDHCAASIADTFQNQPLLVAYVMELGIVFHSVLLGLGLGVVTGDEANVRGLLIAVCVHQFFEGAGLATCVIEAKLCMGKVACMLGFFSLTTPMGIAIGIAASRSYDAGSTTALGVQGTLNALAAGILIYLALVDILGREFSSPEVRGDLGMQCRMFLGVLAGAAIMTALAVFE